LYFKKFSKSAAEAGKAAIQIISSGTLRLKTFGRASKIKEKTGKRNEFRITKRNE
jgi:hypothetical protein